MQSTAPTTFYIYLNHVVCFVCRQGSSVQRPPVGPQWADSDAHLAATVPGAVRVQPAGGNAEPAGMARLDSSLSVMGVKIKGHG